MSSEVAPGSERTQSIAVLDRSLDTSIRVPGSKSHTNRALVCAALATGESTLDGILLADDTEAMLQLLVELGIDVQVDRPARVATIIGIDGRLPRHDGVLDARQSGTTSRFVLPMLALGDGRYVLDGHEQMRARPFGDLVGALGSLGVRVEGEGLPLTVFGSGMSGGSVTIPGSVSSQFLSGLLLSAPCATDTVHIAIDGELVSKPYVDLTLATMSSFGVEVDRDGYRSFTVPATGYRATDLTIEPDASAASYFFAAAAATGGRVRVEGLGTSTLQGDLRFVDILEQMGATVTRLPDATEVQGTGRLHGVDVDMADISDTAQTLAAIAPLADGPVRIRGIGFIRRKETDRIAAVVNELHRLGIRAVEDDDGLTVHPGRPRPGRIETYNDHRMAMSFAILGLVVPGIEIGDPSCVDKTFPDFFELLGSL